MFKTIMILTACVMLSLTGCKTTAEFVPSEPNRATISHPSMPSPIADRSFKTKTITDSTGKLYVGMSYEDDLEFRKYLEDVLKYVKDMKATACFYRTELKETACLLKPETTKKAEPTKIPLKKKAP